MRQHCRVTELLTEGPANGLTRPWKNVIAATGGRFSSHRAAGLGVNIGYVIFARAAYLFVGEHRLSAAVPAMTRMLTGTEGGRALVFGTFSSEIVHHILRLNFLLAYSSPLRDNRIIKL